MRPTKFTHAVAYLLLLVSVLAGCAIQPVQPAGVKSSTTTAAESSATTPTAAAEATVEATATEAPATVEATATTEPVAVEAPASPQEFVIPTIEEGKFNVAFVYSSPIGDGGWTYAHEQGRQIIESFLGDKVHTGYVENVPESDAAVSEKVIRQLAEAGFNAIFTCSFGYMDPTAKVAADFPNIMFVHVSGFKKSGNNFANMFGSMEEMKYLAGMIAGARAKEDGIPRVGYIAPFPIPEVTRYLNATTMGMRRTCPECLMDVRWTFSWFDPEKEKAAAAEMLDAGADVIITGADTTGPIVVAGEHGKWGIGYDSANSCEVDVEHCLTVTYWDWGQAYAWIINKMLDGKFTADDYYFDATSGGLGVVGFMIGQEPAPGVPDSVVVEVQQVLNDMLEGTYDRFNIFKGPINNNKGEIVVPDGVSLTQSDLEGLVGVPGRQACTICMSWLVEGIDPAIDLPQ
ncbi:MAG: BMP family ABC transporter substrate-binding protein [Caldilineaceae bacterium]